MRRAGPVLLALVTLLGVAVPSAAESPEPFEALGLVRLDGGARAPAFTLPDLRGDPVSLSSPPGGAAIVVFWATW